MKKCFVLVLVCFFVSLSAEGVYFQAASEKDFESLELIAQEASAFCGYYPKFEEEEIENPFCICKDHFNGIVRIMMEGSHVIGFYALQRQLDSEDGTWVNLLSHLFLKPEYIGQGYGRLLFQDAMRTARDELHWEALFWEGFPKAVGFYKKMGAWQLGEKPCSINPEYKSQILVYILN